MTKQRAFFSEDGYLFLEISGGSFGDGDMIFEAPHFASSPEAEGAEEVNGGKWVELADGPDGIPVGGHLYDDIDLNRPDLAEQVSFLRAALTEAPAP